MLLVGDEFGFDYQAAEVGAGRGAGDEGNVLAFAVLVQDPDFVRFDLEHIGDLVLVSDTVVADEDLISFIQCM